jgi:hypothetical protein
MGVLSPGGAIETIAIAPGGFFVTFPGVITQIVTHPGGAHKDDFLAVSVLIAKTGAPVERRVPTEADVEDSATALVDIGGSHDPGRHNFDHHHFPREHEPTCALSLVLDHYGLYEDARKFCDWLEPAEWFDSRGPNRTAEWLGVTREAVARLNSPIDVTLLRRFAGSTELRAGETLYEVMRFIGEDLLDFLKTARQRLDRTKEAAQTWELTVAGETIKALFLPREAGMPDEPSASLSRYVRSEGMEKQIVALIYPDRRGEGYGISRYEDHPRLDFSRLSGEQDVHFAHTSGFMCKTSATDPDRLRALVSAAWLS